jgi:hypothetical protein
MGGRIRVSAEQPVRKSAAPQWSRRELLAFGWLPFFHHRHISLNGAHFRILRNGQSNHRYLFIHGDEETARQVLLQFMQTHEGTAFLIEGHTRNVTIDGGQLDPNRMFSRTGAEADLKSQNPNWTPPQVQSALQTLDRERPYFLQVLLPPDRGRLVALHNNSEQYSVMDEVPISDSVSMRDPSDPHAFFLCTDPGDYAILMQAPYNVVLQQKKPQVDDGSLSRLCAMRGIRYVNLEVRMGNADKQTEMLRWLDVNLP